MFLGSGKTPFTGSKGSKYLGTCSPSRVPRLRMASFVVCSSSNRNEFNTKGVLPCGTLYFDCCALFYCDDFQPRFQIFPKGSVETCYMIHIGLSSKTGRSITSAKTISITPWEVPTNYVLDFIVRYIDKKYKQHAPSTDAWGWKCVIFVDIARFLVDYPTLSSVLDAMLHSGRFPCTHYNFLNIEGSVQPNVSPYHHTHTVLTYKGQILLLLDEYSD